VQEKRSVDGTGHPEILVVIHLGNHKGIHFVFPVVQKERRQAAVGHSFVGTRFDRRQRHRDGLHGVAEAVVGQGIREFLPGDHRRARGGVQNEGKQQKV
jgi:hypothetical protein